MFIALAATCMAARPRSSHRRPPSGPPRRQWPIPQASPSAIRTDNLAALRELLKTSDVNYVERRGGATPLMNAAAFGSLDAMRLLVDAGANVNARSYARATALMWAVADLARVRLLVERGADVNACRGCHSRSSSRR
jgi:ankyrin repeat protein